MNPIPITLTATQIKYLRKPSRLSTLFEGMKQFDTCEQFTVTDPAAITEIFRVILQYSDRYHISYIFDDGIKVQGLTNNFEVYIHGSDITTHEPPTNCALYKTIKRVAEPVVDAVTLTLPNEIIIEYLHLMAMDYAIQMCEMPVFEILVTALDKAIGGTNSHKNGILTTDEMRCIIEILTTTLDKAIGGTNGN